MQHETNPENAFFGAQTQDVENLRQQDQEFKREIDFLKYYSMP